jgi:hypothetical protein
VNFGQNVQSAVFDNCTFSMQNANTLISFTSPGANTAAQGIVFRKCTFTGGTSTSYLLNLSLAYGKITFEDCTFTNTTHTPLATITGNNVTFTRCSFTSGTTLVTGATYGTAFSFQPQGQCALTDCTITLGQVDTTELATQAAVALHTTSTGGTLRVARVTFRLASTVTNISTCPFVEMASYATVGYPGSSYEDVTVDFGGKTFGANAQGYGAVRVHGYVDVATTRPQYVAVRRLTLSNLTSGAVGNNGGRYLETEYADIRGLYTYRVTGDTAGVAQFVDWNYIFSTGTHITGAQLALMGSTSGGMWFNGSSGAYGTARVGVLTDLVTYDVTGTFSGPSLYQAGGILRTSTVISNGNNPAVQMVIACIAQDCVLVATASSANVVTVASDCTVSSCLVGNNGTNATVLNGSVSVSNTVVTGSRFLHVSGAAPVLGSNFTGGTNVVNQANVFVIGSVPL